MGDSAFTKKPDAAGEYTRFWGLGFPQAVYQSTRRRGPAEEDASLVKLGSSVKKSLQVSDGSQSGGTVVGFIATVTSYSPREQMKT